MTSNGDVKRFAPATPVDPPDVDRETCIVGSLDGLERARLSLGLWAGRARNQIEKNAVRQLLTQVETLIRQTSNFSRMG